MKRLKVKLVTGREYLFTHKRKRNFRAVYRGIVRAPASDALDEFYYECEVEPHAMALEGLGTPINPAKTVVTIRPSLITLVQDVPPDMPMSAPPTTVFAPPEMSIRQRIGSFLKRLR